MAKKKTLLPTSFRNYLSIISLIGFIGIFLELVFDISYFTDNINAIFLILGGAGLLTIGKVFKIKSWARDGIQENEISFLISIVFGFSAMIIGILMAFNIVLSQNIQSFVGFLALIPATYIFIDYLADSK